MATNKKKYAGGNLKITRNNEKMRYIIIIHEIIFSLMSVIVTYFLLTKIKTILINEKYSMF